MADDIQAVQEHVLSLLASPAASAVLDLGCGAGEHLRALARSVPQGARLVGIDSSEKAINQARAGAAGDSRFEFIMHDLETGIPFPDATFDRVLSVNVLEAIPDKDALLGEIHRVLVPSGLVVIAHFDWDSQLYDGADKAIVRKLVHAFADWKQKWMADADGWMGRRLWRTCQRSGLFQGHIDAYVHTSTSFGPGNYGWERAQDFGSMVTREFITADEYDRFCRTLEELAAQD